ncbi:GSCOCG00004734001-RA-CDS [Cotesia congregata]|nr:GSCOCG00004734001-RA-CDS [Cotesia congregata]
MKKNITYHRGKALADFFHQKTPRKYFCYQATRKSRIQKPKLPKIQEQTLSSTPAGTTIGLKERE